MKSMPTTEELSTQLANIAIQRDELTSKIKEYEALLDKQPESIFQYTEKISAIFYQFSLDLKTINHMNPATEKWCKSSRDDIYQNPRLWFDTIHIDDRQNVIASLHDMVTHQKNEILIEYRLKSKDGNVVYVSDRAVLVNDKKGQPYCIMGFVTDMSEYVNVKREMLVYDQILSVSQTEKSIELAVEAILKISCYSFQWDAGEIWLIDSSTQLLHCIKIWHKNQKDIKETYIESYSLKIKKSEGFQGEVIQNNFPTLVTDYDKNKNYIHGQWSTHEGLKTAFGLPISYQGKQLGVLIYFCKDVKNLFYEEIRSMQRISDVLGHVVHNKISNEQMVYMTHHDRLTGLINRSGLEHKLAEKIENNDHSLMALIMLDLDQFNLINQGMGFDVGDSILKDMATRFIEYLSSSFDMIANIGGDQYAFVLNTMKRAEEIAPLLERIMSIVKTPFIIKGKHVLLTSSIGITIYPYDAMDFLSLLKNADIALNHAKIKGGDSVQYFSETLQKTVTHAINIENSLRTAIAENDLKLYYQPKVDLKSGKIIGLEALLRWQHPQEGLLLPASFISIAEQSDLIVYIGEWVMLEICRHFPLVDIQTPIAFNLSARQFSVKYDIVKFIGLLLDKLSLPAHLLEVEVTESQIMKDPQRSMEILTSLRKIGLSIALDDFGTGYSSFDYLKRFKPNRIKIDKSFIDGLPNDKENVGILRAIIALSKTLNIKVIAEGVETIEQLQCLIDEDCDEMQGFYFSKPLPIYDIMHLMSSKTKLKFPI